MSKALHKRAFLDQFAHLANPDTLNHVAGAVSHIGTMAGSAAHHLGAMAHSGVNHLVDNAGSIAAMSAASHVGANGVVKAIRTTSNNRFTQSLGELGVKHGLQGKEVHPFVMDRIKQIIGPELVAEYTGAKSLVHKGVGVTSVEGASSLIDKAEKHVAGAHKEVDTGVRKLRGKLGDVHSTIDDVALLAKAHRGIANQTVDNIADQVKSKADAITNASTPLAAALEKDVHSVNNAKNQLVSMRSGVNGAMAGAIGGAAVGGAKAEDGHRLRGALGGAAFGAVGGGALGYGSNVLRRSKLNTKIDMSSHVNKAVDKFKDIAKGHVSNIEAGSAIDNATIQAKASVGVAGHVADHIADPIKAHLPDAGKVSEWSSKLKSKLPDIHNAITNGATEVQAAAPIISGKAHEAIDSVGNVVSKNRADILSANHVLQQGVDHANSAVAQASKATGGAVNAAKGAVHNAGVEAANQVGVLKTKADEILTKQLNLKGSATLSLASEIANQNVAKGTQVANAKVMGANAKVYRKVNNTVATANHVGDVTNKATQSLTGDGIDVARDTLDASHISAYKRLSRKAKYMVKDNLGMSQKSKIEDFPIVGDVQKSTDAYFGNGGNLTKHTGFGGKIINGMTNLLDKASVPTGYNKGLAHPKLRHAANVATIGGAYFVPGTIEHVTINTAREYASKLPSGSALFRSRVQQGFTNEPVKLFGKFGPKVVEGKGILGKARRAVGDYGFSPTAWGETRDFGVRARESGMSQENLDKALDAIAGKR